MEFSGLSVVIPTYCERENIAVLLYLLGSHLDAAYASVTNHSAMNAQTMPLSGRRCHPTLDPLL
jgi:hypothetical protein